MVLERIAKPVSFSVNRRQMLPVCPCLLSVGGPYTKFHISVYEPKVSYYSRLGMVVAAYNSKQNGWHCPCSKARHSCLHKSVENWHLFATQRGLFKKVKSTEQETISPQPTTDRMDTSEMKEGSYPPNDQGVAKNAK